MDIRTEGVQAVLGGSAILKGVDIQVGQRELVGIIGPNGSGKSTLLKCIYRVLKPTGGAVLLDGRDLEPVQLSGVRPAHCRGSSTQLL